MGDSLGKLLSGCLRGEEGAVRALVERYQNMVFGLCIRLLHNRQDAEDVVQETFIRAVRSLSCYDRKRPFEPWLLAIAANRCRSLMAARARHRHVEVAWETIPAGESDPTGVRHLQEEVNRALDHLRPEYRQAFVMFHQMEMSYADIAQVLNCPINTVKTWIHRARRHLIAQLQARQVVTSHGASS